MLPAKKRRYYRILRKILLRSRGLVESYNRRPGSGSTYSSENTWSPERTGDKGEWSPERTGGEDKWSPERTGDRERWRKV